jgi:putative membrane protein
MITEKVKDYQPSATLLPATIRKNDKLAKSLIWIFSLVIFFTITVLGRVKINVDLGFDTHLFAKANAFINASVSILLVLGMIAVKRRSYLMHKRFMFAALILSVIFLLSYVCHHLFTGETKYGGEGVLRGVYFFILLTHIFLAAIILPFVLFTSYRALIAEWPAHRKIARITWPIWLYVSVTGVIVYLMISPYYT